jgi:hypothetical protein
MNGPDLNLQGLRLLVLIADLGSISAAAREERISQRQRANGSRCWKFSSRLTCWIGARKARF